MAFKINKNQSSKKLKNNGKFWNDKIMGSNYNFFPIIFYFFKQNCKLCPFLDQNNGKFWSYKKTLLFSKIP
jgi:hypothetical protein